MALEAVVYQQSLFSNKEVSNLLELNNWSHNFFEENHDHDNWSFNDSYILQHGHDHHDYHGLSPNLSNIEGSDCTTATVTTTTTSTTTTTRVKRRRSRTRKNKEDIENQRMTHIAVERNRRKLMNEYLSILRSLMPDSYVQRGDQASIIGGAINYVKELEQALQLRESNKELKQNKRNHPETSSDNSTPSLLPFSEFFTFPQYTLLPNTASETMDHDRNGHDRRNEADQWKHSIADIEVTMVETHANVKIRSKKKPKQLIRVVSGLHSLRLTILHLNVTTAAQIVLYSLSLKVEEDCKLSSVDEIAKAVYEILSTIHGDSAN